MPTPIEKIMGGVVQRRDRLAADRLLGQLNDQEIRPESEMLRDPNFQELSQRFPGQADRFRNERQAIRDSLKVQDEASELAFFKDMREVMTRLEGGDLTGAKSVLLNRRIGLNQIQGAETDDVDRILNRLENEDFQGAMNDLAMADRVAVRNGILPPLEVPEGFTLREGEIRFGSRGNPIASNIPERNEGFTLSEGAQRFDSEGNLIAENEPKEEDENITSSQRLAASFAQRTTDAGQILTDLGPKFTGFLSRAAGIVPRGAQSEDRQKFDQASRDFINAVLRRESGAAISPSEFENAQLQYIPQPGDSEAVLDQKRQNRETISEALRLEAGDAFDQLQSVLEPPLVDVLGELLEVGTIVENAQGQQGRVEADGSITPL